MPRYVARIIDHDIPRAALERIELAVAIALQLLELREELGVRMPPIEQSHRVTACHRALGDVDAEELGAAENQDAQRTPCVLCAPRRMRRSDEGAGCGGDEDASIHRSVILA